MDKKITKKIKDLVKKKIKEERLYQEYRKLREEVEKESSELSSFKGELQLFWSEVHKIIKNDLV